MPQMSIIVVTEADKKAIAEGIARARANPTPWNVLEAIANDDPTNKLKSYQQAEEIDKVFRKYPTQCFELGTVRVAFNFEYQPSGLYRHISFSIGKKGKVLDFIPSKFLIKEFGFSGLPPVNVYRVWTEEYEKGMFAINIIELVEEGAKDERENA
jgi:hypothetical protein